MKKKVKLILLLMVFALALSAISSLGNFGGSWFGDSVNKHNSSAGNIPSEDENETPEEPEEPKDPEDPEEPLDPSTFTVTLSSDGIATANTTLAWWALYDVLAVSNGNCVEGFYTSSPVDFSQYMEVGKEYAVKVNSVKEFHNEGVFWSNWITFEGSASDSFTVCPECNVEYNSSLNEACPNPECPLNQSTERRCPVCNVGYLNEVSGTCNNLDCPSNMQVPDPVTTCPECGQEYNTETYDACPNADCELNKPTEIRCTVCGIGVLSEGTGKCNNPDCSSNRPNTMTMCPECGQEYNAESYDSCPNENCSLNEPVGILCPDCNSAYLTEGTGECSSPSCPSNFVEEEVIVTPGWLFQNQPLTTIGNKTLPVPVPGGSYTCFVGGVEIGTYSADEDRHIEFSNYDDNGQRTWVIYWSDMGWSFHPIDSDVTSGSVSVYFNGMGEEWEEPEESILCPECNRGYLSEGDGTCSNVYCSSHITVTLSEQGVATAPTADANWHLYDAMTDALICKVAALGTPIDFSEYMENGRSYYVLLSQVAELDSQGVFRSNTITYVVQKEQEEISCPVCGTGVLNEGNGKCNNSDCDSNQVYAYCSLCGEMYNAAIYPACPYEHVRICPDCGQEYNFEDLPSCPNVNCPSFVPTEIPCPDCTSGFLMEGTGKCDNPDCQSNNPPYSG